MRFKKSDVQEYNLRIQDISLFKRTFSLSVILCIFQCRQCKQMSKQQGYYTQSSPERAFYCHSSPKHQNQPEMQQISCFSSAVPRLPLLALELPGVHPPEPCHGAARIGGHGSYHPVGQRMEEVEAVERTQMPIRDCTIFCLKNNAAD